VALPGGESLALDGHGRGLEAGRPVTLGLRPEHLEQTSDGDDVAHLRVDVVEQLGADTIVHGHFGASSTDLTVRLPGVRHLRAGEVLPLSVSPAHVHLFATESGARLGA
jgi:sn-glycerol 3-phosphate transport system ATP-binding protein